MKKLSLCLKDCKLSRIQTEKCLVTRYNCKDTMFVFSSRRNFDDSAAGDVDKL